MILASKFDVLRGWPREGAIDETFKAATAVELVPGSVVEVQSDGLTVDKATTPNMTAANAKAPWVVVEGNDDFSGTFTGKVVCIRANAMLRLDPANLTAGTYTPGLGVSFNAGKFQVAVATNQIIGEVIKDDTAIDGTVVVYFHGGAGIKV